VSEVLPVELIEVGRAKVPIGLDELDDDEDGVPEGGRGSQITRGKY
jgi:hypothetical protein